MFALVALSLSSTPSVYSCRSGFATATITPGYIEPASAWVSFNDSYSDIGWGEVHIWTNATEDPLYQMYCAGYADGYATAHRIREAYDLFNESQLMNESTGTYPNPDWPPQWHQFFNDNIDYIRQQTQTKNESYWFGIKLILNQFSGLLNGTNARLQELNIPLLREIDLWILQSAGDLDDLAEALDSPPGIPLKDPEFTQKCTALLRVTPGNQELYFAHDTWSDVRDLHAYLKEYNFSVPQFAANLVTISTRTGHLASGDDFWTNDQGLLIFETTMHNFNPSLYSEFITSKSVLCWIRALLATFMSTDGKSWTETFIRENSGTYNNEYVVLDTKLFTPGEDLPDNLVWMIEQLPGHYHSEDVTDLLRTKKYLESINTPQFQDIWDLANYTGEEDAYPAKRDFWSFTGQIRDKLIVRDAGRINDYEGFQKFMQYNNWKNDPLMIINGTGEREPAQGILARYDLRPWNGTSWGVQNHFAGLDVKSVNVNEWIRTHVWDARLSPTYDSENWGYGPFDFDDWPNISHTGIAAVWTYDWVKFQPADICAVFALPGDEDNCTSISGCGFCIPTQTCMRGTKEGPLAYYGSVCDPISGWKWNTPLPSWAVPVIASISALVVIFVVAVFGLAIYGRRKSSRQNFRAI